MKKHLSLLLAVCMVLPLLSLLPLPQLSVFAAEVRAVPTVGTTTAFPGASNKNLPTVANGKVTFHGNWTPFMFVQGQYNVGGVVPMNASKTPLYTDATPIHSEKYEDEDRKSVV